MATASVVSEAVDSIRRARSKLSNLSLSVLDNQILQLPLPVRFLRCVDTPFLWCLVCATCFA